MFVSCPCDDDQNSDVAMRSQSHSHCIGISVSCRQSEVVCVCGRWSKQSSSLPCDVDRAWDRWMLHQEVGGGLSSDAAASRFSFRAAFQRSSRFWRRALCFRWRRRFFHFRVPYSPSDISRLSACLFPVTIESMPRPARRRRRHVGPTMSSDCQAEHDHPLISTPI